MHWMRTSGLATCLLLLGVGVGAQAQSHGAAPGLIVTYVEASPAKGAALAAALKAYAGQIETSAGKPGVIVLRELGRPTRMAVLEQWPDLTSAAYTESEGELAGRVQTDALAPMDRRVNHPLTPARVQTGSAEFWVLMHLDVSPDYSAEAAKILVAQAEAVLAAPGALGYEVAAQDKRANHFAVYEVWKSRAAYESYTATAPGVEFRLRFGALIASPFDDRFYVKVGR